MTLKEIIESIHDKMDEKKDTFHICIASDGENITTAIEGDKKGLVSAMFDFMDDSIEFRIVAQSAVCSYLANNISEATKFVNALEDGVQMAAKLRDIKKSIPDGVDILPNKNQKPS